MSYLAQDLRFAVRNLARRPGFTVVALLTLALGIGANTAVFSVVNAIVLNRLPFREPERLVTLGGNFISTAEMLYMQEHAQQLADFASYSPGWGMALTSDGEPAQITTARGSVNLLPMLGVAPLVGRGFSADESTPGRDRVVLLGHALWRDRFGSDTGVIGKALTLDSSPYTVIGVLPADFELVGASSMDMLLPQTIDPSAWFHRGQNALGIGRLATNATPQSALTELRGLVPEMRQAFEYNADYGRTFDILPLHDYIVGPVRTLLLVLLGAVGFIVLIASANVGNLLLVRATERHRDVALRIALGASRGRVVRGVALESLALALGGTLLGVVIALAGVAVLRRILPSDLPRLTSIAVDGQVLLACAAVGALVGLVALVPALASTRAEPSDALRARSDTAGRIGARWRGVLVSAEMALAVVLVVGAGLMMKTLWRLGNVDPGFHADRVLTFRLQPTGKTTPQYREYFGRVLEEVAALPGVQTVGGIHHLPMSGYNWWANIEVEGRPLAPGEAPVRGGWRIIEGDYLRTMGIPMVAGRAFTQRDDASAERVVVINDVLARRLFPGEDPLGRRLRAGNATRGEWVRIVGVSEGVRHQAVEVEPDPEMYFPLAQVGMSFMNIVVRTVSSDPLTLAEATRRTLRAIDPAVPIAGMRALSTVVAESSARQRLVLQLLAAFAAIGLLLAAIGVYGVVAFGVTQRRHEIGVRTALGARREAIISLILRQGLRHALIGLAVGVPAAFTLTRTMRSVVYQVSTADPLTYVAVVVVLVSAAVIASWLPARRAAALNPVAVLRGD